jgi:hypothetical protein
MNNERLQELYAQKEYKKLEVKVGQYIEIHEKL